MIICHRGITKFYPENTIGSINDTIKDKRYDGIEIDIQLTKDNEWVIYHDYNLLRLNSINAELKYTNYYDLNLIEWKGNKFKINRLEELLELETGNFIFNIEIKTNFIETNEISKLRLKNILNRSNFKFFLSSFDHDWSGWVDNNLYHIDFGYLTEDKIPKYGNLWIIDHNILNKLDVLDVIENNIKIGVYGENFLNKNDYDIITYQIVDDLENKKVYIDGIFDIVDINLLNLLKKAKLEGDTLIVGVLDYSNEISNPKNTLEDRVAVLKSLKIIDDVIFPAPFKGSKNGNLDKKFLQINEINKVIGNVENSNNHYQDAIELGLYKII